MLVSHGQSPNPITLIPTLTLTLLAGRRHPRLARPVLRLERRQRGLGRERRQGQEGRELRQVPRAAAAEAASRCQKYRLVI